MTLDLKYKAANHLHIKKLSAQLPSLVLIIAPASIRDRPLFDSANSDGNVRGRPLI